MKSNFMVQYNSILKEKFTFNIFNQIKKICLEKQHIFLILSFISINTFFIDLTLKPNLQAYKNKVNKMAVIKKAKQTIHNLEEDLNSINLALSTERSTTQGEVSTLQSNIDTVQVNLNTESTSRQTADTGLSNRLDVIEGADTVSGSVAKALKDAKDYTDTLENGKVSTIESLLNVVNGDSTVSGSFRKSISDLINSAPEAFDTLKELSDELASNKSLDEALATLVASNHSAIKGSVTSAYDDLGKIEASLNLINANESTVNSVRYLIKIVQDDTNTRLVKANNLSDLTDVSVARTNIDVYSKAQVDDAVRLGGAIAKTDLLTVSANKIVLSFTPKNDFIMNFGQAQFIDSSNFLGNGAGLEYLMPITKDATDSSGKTYVVNGDTVGQFDGQALKVQYEYIAS